MVGLNGARLEYPLINKVEHVVIESMECVEVGMHHLIWGRMVMSVYHLAATDLSPTPIGVRKPRRGMQGQVLLGDI